MRSEEGIIMSRYLKKKKIEQRLVSECELFELFCNQLIFYIMKCMVFFCVCVCVCVCEKNIIITEPMDKSTCVIKKIYD